MKWRTRITELFGIKYPIIEGALAGIGTVDLAVAVSEAGALGMITAWMLRSPEKLRSEIRRFRSMSDKPFAVNLSPTMDDKLLDMLAVAIEERVPVIETAGSRAAAYGQRIKDAGLIWMHKVQTIRHALAAERDGADVIGIQGLEGAGLKNPAVLPTMISVAMAAKSVKAPIVAAGGIGDGRTFLGALALGAEAVLLGTVFCAVTESPLGERHKEALINADPYAPEWRDPILTTPKPGDLQRVQEAVGTRAIMQAAGKAENFGIPKAAGTGAISLAIAFINKIVPAKELIEGMIQEAEDIMGSTCQQVNPPC